MRRCIEGLLIVLKPHWNQERENTKRQNLFCELICDGHNAQQHDVMYALFAFTFVIVTAARIHREREKERKKSLDIHLFCVHMNVCCFHNLLELITEMTFMGDNMIFSHREYTVHACFSRKFCLAFKFHSLSFEPMFGSCETLSISILTQRQKILLRRWTDCEHHCRRRCCCCRRRCCRQDNLLVDWNSSNSMMHSLSIDFQIEWMIFLNERA